MKPDIKIVAIAKHAELEMEVHIGRNKITWIIASNNYPRDIARAFARRQHEQKILHAQCRSVFYQIDQNRLRKSSKH